MIPACESKLASRSSRKATVAKTVFVEQAQVLVPLKSFEDVSMVSHCTEHEDMVVSQKDHMLYCYTKRCCSLQYSQFSTQTSWCCGCICTLCLLFRFHTMLLALPHSHHNFCHFVIVTMRPLVPLDVLNMHHSNSVSKLAIHKVNFLILRQLTNRYILMLCP